MFSNEGNKRHWTTFAPKHKHCFKKHKVTEPSAKEKTLYCNQSWYFNNIMNSLVVRSPVWLF